MDEMKRNGSGYNDPTPYKAYRNISDEREKISYKLARTLFNMAHLVGFEVVNITLKDKKTGKIYHRK